MFLRYSYLDSNGMPKTIDQERVSGLVLIEDSLSDLLNLSIKEEKEKKTKKSKENPGKSSDGKKYISENGEEYISRGEFSKKNKNFPIKTQSISSFINKCMTGHCNGWPSLKPFVVKVGSRFFIKEEEFKSEFDKLNNYTRRFI
jgi:hypothetical protein